MPSPFRVTRMPLVIALLTALLVLSAMPASVGAAVTVDTAGHTGAWSVTDTATAAALRCTYDESHNLAQLTVAPPVMKGTARRARLVGWQIQVWRAEWWARLPDQWYLAYSSDIAQATATKKRTAVLSDKTWTVPAAFQTNYDSLKVDVVLHWYGAQKHEIGHTTVELEYYGQEQAGQVFDPMASTFAGHCLGSQNAPQPPPVDPVASVPAGFVKMSHWRPYWKSFSADAVQANIDTLTAMHQTGVILTGVQTGNKYSLPANVATYLQMFRDAGITPYLSLWIGKFSPAETDTSVRAWQAGNGLWGGIVIDVEAGLLATVRNNGRPAAVSALDAFMARVRPLTPFLAYSTMPIPTDFPDMLYSELNSYADVFMPQLYVQGGAQALFLLDKMQASIDYEETKWADPSKPIIPVVNDWGSAVNVDGLRSYIQIALSRYGAISGWRIHPSMKQEVQDLWATFPS